MDWKQIPAAEAGPGDFAEHVEKQLDPRVVTRIAEGGVWLDIMGVESGPFPLENYRFTRPVTV